MKMGQVLDEFMLASLDPGDPMGDNCTYGSQWIHEHFKQCVRNTVQYLAFILGFTAVALWLCAHIMLLGVRQREANPSRRELLLILHMCAANICNLTGASLSEQLGTQVFAAAYLIVTDVVFLAHFCYMWYIYRPHPEGTLEFQYSEWRSPNRARAESDDNAILACLALPWLSTIIYIPGFFKDAYHYEAYRGTGRSLLIVGESSKDNFGYALGFIAAVAYWAASMPRVFDAHNRKDYLNRRFKVHFFFILANIFYVLSIIMYDQQVVFLINELPWLIGSVGCIFLDVFIVYLVLFKENQVIWERKAEAQLGRIATVDDEVLRHPEDGSQVERTRLDEEALHDRHDSWNELSETLDGKRLSLILEIDEPENIIMEQQPPPRGRPQERSIKDYLVPSNTGTGPGIDDDDDDEDDLHGNHLGGDTTDDESIDSVDGDKYVFETVGQRKPKGKFGDDLEWDFADISQQYDDDDESKWHTARQDDFTGWDDDDRIIQEVDAELQGGLTDESLEFEDEMANGRDPSDLWYDPNTENVSN